MTGRGVALDVPPNESVTPVPDPVADVTPRPRTTIREYVGLLLGGEHNEMPGP